MIRAVAVLALSGLCLSVMALSARAQEPTDKGTGVILRGLDKVNGTTSDLEMRIGGTSTLGRLQIDLGECRYPEGDPSGDAYAFVTIRDSEHVEPLFSGWMVASAPALNALDHPRYDIWVLRCKTS